MAATLLTAQDANWNMERLAYNILVDQQPAGIALPRSADDVSRQSVPQPPTANASPRSAPDITLCRLAL